MGIYVIEEDGSVSFYVWTVMFLGISDAVFIFSAMLKLVRVYLSSKGIANVIYIDDLFLLGRNKELCVANNAFAVEVLGKAGWVMSLSKSTGPASRLTFLWLDICSIQMKFFLPEKKIVSILSQLETAFISRKMQAMQLASMFAKFRAVTGLWVLLSG